MKNVCIFFILTLLISMNACTKKATVQYPVTRKVDTIDNYFGTKVPDPYRWLENDTSAETAGWVEAENAVTNGYLETIPFRDKIRQRLTKIWNYPKFGVPFREGPYYFFFKNDGLQNQSVLYVRKEVNGIPTVLLDPNKLSEDGTIALEGTSVSHDGKYLAYSIARSGSDWNEVMVLEIATGKKLPDTLRWVKFSGMAWQNDGFYYSRYDAPAGGSALSGKNENKKVYYHKAGTDQKQDKLIYQNPKYPMRSYGASVTEDERFLFIDESESTYGNALYYRDLSKPMMPFRQLTEGFDYDYEVVDNIGDKFLIITNYQAPKKKLILMDPDHPEPRAWKTIIPERDDVLESVSMAGDVLVSEYMQNAASKAFIYTQEGKFLHPCRVRWQTGR